VCDVCVVYYDVEFIVVCVCVFGDVLVGVWVGDVELYGGFFDVVGYCCECVFRGGDVDGDDGGVVVG